MKGKIFKIISEDQNLDRHTIEDVMKTAQAIRHLRLDIEKSWKWQKITDELSRRGYMVLQRKHGDGVKIVKSTKETILEEIISLEYDRFTRTELIQRLESNKKFISEIENVVSEIAKPKVDYHQETEVMRQQVIDDMITKAKDILNRIRNRVDL